MTAYTYEMTRYKCFLLLILAVSVFSLVGVCNLVSNKDRVLDELHYCIDDEENLKLYKSDNTLYAFLPSGAELENVRFECEQESTYINGKEVNSGDSMTESGIKLGDSNELSYKNKKYEFIAMQSANVPTLFISNATGNFDEVYEDKDHKEPIRLSLKDEKGNDLYTDVGDICGRGNSTWLLDKKPFNIYLDKEVSLLGLQASNKFCLLANGYDESNLRDKLIYDFANEIEPNWTPGCEYVDLYINGEYYGLYLLSESVQVSESKININPDTGYWFSMSIPSRKSELDDYIVTGEYWSK